MTSRFESYGTDTIEFIVFEGETPIYRNCVYATRVFADGDDSISFSFDEVVACSGVKPLPTWGDVTERKNLIAKNYHGWYIATRKELLMEIERLINSNGNHTPQ